MLLSKSILRSVRGQISDFLTFLNIFWTFQEHFHLKWVLGILRCLPIGSTNMQYQQYLCVLFSKKKKKKAYSAGESTACFSIKTLHISCVPSVTFYDGELNCNVQIAFKQPIAIAIFRGERVQYICKTFSWPVSGQTGYSWVQQSLCITPLHITYSMVSPLRCWGSLSAACERNWLLSQPLCNLAPGSWPKA